MQKILITGACGYIGSQLLDELKHFEEAALIRIYDNFSTGSYKALLELPSQHTFELIEGDILNPHALITVMKDVDIVIHLAAVVLTPMGLGSTKMAEQVNHWGTVNVLEAAIKNKVKHFIHASSTAVYGPMMEGKQKGEFRPFGAYANSKYHAEQTIKGYVDRGLDITILRIGTVYGLAKVTRFDAVINKFICTAGTKKMISVHGKGTQKRPSIHIKDAASAILYVLKNKEDLKNRSLDVVEKDYSVNNIAETIVEIFENIKLRYIDQDIRNHYSFVAEGKKLDEYGWSPTYNLAYAISKDIPQFNGFRKLKLI